MPTYHPPDQFHFSKPASWPDWKFKFLRHHTLKKLKDEPGVMFKSLLLYMSWVIRQRISTAPSHLTQSQKQLRTSLTHQIQQTILPVLQKFDTYSVPHKNTIYEQMKFYQRSQEVCESVECFVRTLPDLAAHCNLATKSRNT